MKFRCNFMSFLRSGQACKQLQYHIKYTVLHIRQSCGKKTTKKRSADYNKRSFSMCWYISDRYIINIIRMITLPVIKTGGVHCMFNAQKICFYLQDRCIKTRINERHEQGGTKSWAKCTCKLSITKRAAIAAVVVRRTLKEWRANLLIFNVDSADFYTEVLHSHVY